MAKDKTTIEDIFAEGEEFKAGGRDYRVLPVLLKEMKAFRTEVFGYNVGYLIEDEGKAEQLSTYMEKYIRNVKGEHVSLEAAMEASWTTRDLEELLKKWARVSG